MSSANLTSAARGRLLVALRTELMGPSDPIEQISEFPTTRYIVGRLAPARADESDDAAKIESTENDSLGVGADADEDGEEDSSPPLIIGFSPSSFGLSFLVDSPSRKLKIAVTWGDYRREKRDGGGYIWQRYPREALIDGVSTAAGKILPITLGATDPKPPGVTVSGVDEPEISIEGVVHEFAQYRAVSLFLVNRRTKGALGDRNKDERWIYQPKLVVAASDGTAAFVAKDALSATTDGEDGETVTNALLYLHAQEFATGHGVAAGWESDAGESRARAIFTEFIPDREIPLLIAPAEDAGSATLDMRALANIDAPSKIKLALMPLVESYEAWITGLKTLAQSAEIAGSKELRDAASENIRLCTLCAERMREGVELIATDAHVFEAFRFANSAMVDQRIHSLWAASNRAKGAVSGTSTDFDKPSNRTWRPFQMGFMLISLKAIADAECAERSLVDLLWFPTGGGKTEAYLGLSAFTMGLRRLRGDKHGMQGSAGVSILMRYTLRLLTVQQFQRATALVAACEVIRRGDPARWGNEPFRAGIWVGRGTTPNTFAESKHALDDLEGRTKPREGSPVQLVSCPRCGTALVNDKGFPEKNTYVADNTTKRTLIWCPNESCEFSAGQSNRSGLPVVVVDDEIYRTCPSLVVGTVDKFARLPFKGEARALFGLRNRFSVTFGHLTEAHGDTVDGKRVRDAVASPRLLPPELIIQDELHLISGPLGTMVGLYETIVDYATSFLGAGGKRIGPKVIASTATIRRAAEQSRQLFARSLRVFPPPGLTSSDSFFAREQPIDPENDSTAGRLYVGVNAPGSSTKTLLVRVYSVLLAAAAREMSTDVGAADPYGTLVGYFNSLRALGGAKRLVEDDIKLVRLKYLAQQQGFPRRPISDPEELTSRLESWKIPGLLKKLDIAFPRGGNSWPVDVLLATNMISVGVDIDRLGLMVVTGQPKTTAEYIQATSRIGRKHPGLVVTMYNWLGARDLSHYERFQSYHAALYKYVEAISVTPFSSRALDRGLRGAFAAMNRLAGAGMVTEPGAQNFDAAGPTTAEIIDEICRRAALLVGQDNAQLVRARLLSARDDWAHLASDFLRYSWLSDSTRPPNNSRVLLRTSGTDNEGEWSAPGSLREVEPSAAFFLEQGEE